jgi:hypothetical protein
MGTIGGGTSGVPPVANRLSAQQEEQAHLRDLNDGTAQTRPVDSRPERCALPARST